MDILHDLTYMYVIADRASCGLEIKLSEGARYFDWPQAIIKQCFFMIL